MGGVAYVDWNARDNVVDALKDKHFRQIDLGNGRYQTRRHIDDQLLPLRAHLDDQQFNREDDFVSVELLDLAQASVTCEMLSPEEMLIRIEEEAELDEADPVREPAEKESDEPEEEQEVRPLGDYYMQLFGITIDDHIDRDAEFHGICCKEPKLQHRGRPNWITA